MRILALLTDAFGGRGGIAQYNRHFLKALCDDSRVKSVVALPRVAADPPGDLPNKLEFSEGSLGGIAQFGFTLFRRILSRDSFDIVVCGHVNLLPLAFLAAYRFRAKLALLTFGMEVWRPPARHLSAWLLPHVDAIATISITTRDRMLAWLPGVAPAIFVIPNAFDPALYSPGPKPEGLVQRYDLHKKLNLLIFGRMDPSERRKGFDELLEATPALLSVIPEIAIIMAGDGADRARLVQKATDLGIGDHVVFTGFIPEEEKLDLYRLADACILPSRQEGFGFVLLEAMACGTPAIGSIADGSREAVLNGQIGFLVDPTSTEDIVRVVSHAIRHPRGVPSEISFFAFDQFKKRVSALLTTISNTDSHS